jgi:hypothetical protein
MGSRQFEPEASARHARPILSERDYENAKLLLEREMKNAHSERVWERLEALMQEVAEYESRFLQGEDEDTTGWVEYAYTSALEQAEGPRRRWSDVIE